MDRERLKSFRHIETGLKIVRKDIAAYNKAIEKSTGMIVSDTTTGSSLEFPYIPRHYQIQGIDSSSRDRYIKRLRSREVEYDELIMELEEWLEGIKDPLMYDIIKLKMRNNLTDSQIAAELGYSRQRIGQLINEFLKADKD